MATGYLPVTIPDVDLDPDEPTPHPGTFPVVRHDWHPTRDHRTACGIFVNWTVSVFSNRPTERCPDCYPGTTGPAPDPEQG